MQRTLVQLLACPQCGSGIELNPAQTELDCSGCLLSYPLRDGVPVLQIASASARQTESPDPVFDALLAEAAAAPFSGWDLSWVAHRCTTTTETDPPLTEMYERRARELVQGAASLLDLGTGGGERLARFAPLPATVIATEAYPPNVSIAADRLAAFEVQVVHADPNTHNSGGPESNRWPERRLPLANNSFDLVLASRSAFSPLEVARVLRPGGRLLTIQGGVEWRGETLADALGGTPPDWTLPGRGWNVGDTFRRSGLRILNWREQATTTTFHDIAVVFMLLHVPWSIVDFDAQRYRPSLYRLYQRMQREGPFTTRGYQYLIEAQKP